MSRAQEWPIQWMFHFHTHDREVQIDVEQVYKGISSYPRVHLGDYVTWFPDAAQLADLRNKINAYFEGELHT